jgi:hypothetical protein
MKKLAQFVIALCFISEIQAQTFEKIFSFTSGANTNEYANAGFELSNGNYLIGVTNRLLCLAPNGDSLWSKTYIGYGDITKIFKDNNNNIMLATTFGKMRFLRINQANGDTLSTFYAPQQTSNSGYTIYDVVVLNNNDYVIAYTNGGGNGSALKRFTPGSTAQKWNNDYGGLDFSAKGLYLDDTTIIMAGYRGNPSFQYDLYVRKITQSNTIVWSKQLKRNLLFKDRLVGVQKNTLGHYLVATSFNVNNKLLPAIAVLGNNGDSLAVNSIAAHNGIAINHGYLVSLKPSPNGFYASGSLNYNTNKPTSGFAGLGYMSAFQIDNNGNITGSAAYNKVGFFLFAPNNYQPSEGWGNGCFLTSDGHYLLYGIGSKIYQGVSGSAPALQWRGYVTKSANFVAVGLKENEATASSISIYPNPTNDEINIKHTDNFNNATITIYSVLGTKVISQSLNGSDIKMNVSGLDAGVYFVEVNANQKKYSAKFVKE